MTSETRTSVQEQVVEAPVRTSEDRFAVRWLNCPENCPVDVMLAISATSQVVECQSFNDRGVILASIPLEFSRVIIDAEHEAQIDSITIDAGANGGKWCFEQVSEMACSEQRFSSLPGKLASAGALRTDFEREFRVCRQIRASTDERRAEVIFARPSHGRRSPVAVKITSANDAGLIREMRALRQLNSHPNIVRMHEAYELYNPTRWAMVTDALTGGNLFQRVRELGGPVGDSRALNFVEHIFKGLLYMHEQGIVHRDVKPDNVVLVSQETSQLQLIDFGLATHEGDPEMQRRCGTPGYIAPEVLCGQPYGCNVDCFSAGVVLHFLLKGIDPFGGQPVAKVLKRNVRCHVSYDHPTLLGCRSLLCECLQADPKSRCTSRWALEETQRLAVACVGHDASPASAHITYRDQGDSANPVYAFRFVEGENGGMVRHFKPLDKKPGEAKRSKSADVKAASSQPKQTSKQDARSKKFELHERKFGFATGQPNLPEDTNSISKGSTRRDSPESDAGDSWKSWHVSSAASSSNASSGCSTPKSTPLFSDPSSGSPGGGAGGYPLANSSDQTGLKVEQAGRKVSGKSSKRKTAAFQSFLQEGCHLGNE